MTTGWAAFGRIDEKDWSFSRGSREIETFIEKRGGGVFGEVKKNKKNVPPPLVSAERQQVVVWVSI